MTRFIQGQITADEFNKKYPVGTEVIYRPNRFVEYSTKTVGRAFEIGLRSKRVCVHIGCNVTYVQIDTLEIADCPLAYSPKNKTEQREWTSEMRDEEANRFEAQAEADASLPF